MSFVLFAGCQYFGMMIGDRRSLVSDGNIKSDNEIKVRKINSNVITCAGGSEAVIHVVWRTVLEQDFKNNITYSECVDIFRKKCMDIKAEYLSLVQNQYLYTSIGIMGFKNGIISLTTINFLENDIEFIEKEYATADDNGFVYFASGKNGAIKDVFSKKFQLCPRFTLENLKSLFYQTLRLCKDNDNSINDRYIMEYIARRDLIERDKIKIDR